jgi:hypothetical protein
MRLVTLVALAACGGDHAAPDAPPVDSTDAPPSDFTPECHMAPAGAAPFTKGADFGPAIAGSLAGWDPSGRWFLTGTGIGGVSSFFFERQGNQVIVDRDPRAPGTIDDTELFQRFQGDDGNGGTFVLAKRVSNLLPDGSLRGQRASCDGGECKVCTAKLIRATHNGSEGEGDHITLLGQLNDPTWGPGYTFNVRFIGTLAYLIRQDGLHIIDTTDPAHPVERGHYKRAGDGYSNDVKLVDAAGGKRYAIIADFPVDVVDVTNPAAPALVGQIAEQSHTLAVETRGGKTYAYFGNYDATCPVYDVTNPAAPLKLGSFAPKMPNGQAPSLVHDLSVDNGIVYLSAWEAGLVVVDYTNPASPTKVGQWAPTPTQTSHSNWTARVAGRHIALHGEEAYDAKMDIVDVDPASATFMQPFATYQTRSWISIHNIMVFGTKSYFSYYQDGIRVLDIADPAHPTLVGYYNTWDPQADYTSSGFFEGSVGLDVDLSRKLIYVADSPRGLLILHDDTP